MTEITHADLWLPGQDHKLNQEYPVPSPTELQDAWATYVGSGEHVAPAPGVFGVVRMPNKPASAYASVDLCEVLRQTSAAVYQVEKNPEDPIACIHHYAEGLSITNDTMPVVQTLMAGNCVPPVAHIDKITAIMRQWRQMGVYVFANTSTLPGCELSTIRFFQQYAPDAFDALLLPRNHDGSLPVTKGIAARNLLQLFGEHYGPRPVVAAHIDDLAHHNAGFRHALSELPSVTTATFQPIYPSHFAPDTKSIPATTPLHAFMQANGFLLANLRR